MNKFMSYLKMGGGSQIVARLLGIFLLVTAGLKIHGLIVDPYGQENFLTTPWMQLLAVEVEVLLGLWLLSGVQQRLVLFASLIVFLGFACFSFYLAWQGQADCGCFGKVKVNPWVTTVIDACLAMVTTFAILFRKSQPSSIITPARSTGRIIRNTIDTLAIAASCLIVIFLAISLYFGDPLSALAKLRGETLTISPAITQLGDRISGTSETFIVSLHNYGNEDITIFGGTTTCGCVASQDLPLIVHVGESKQVKVQVKFSGSPGAFSHRYSFFSDGEKVVTTAVFRGYVMHNRPLTDIGSKRATSP
jgi:hypothetical protein